MIRLFQDRALVTLRVPEQEQEDLHRRFKYAMRDLGTDGSIQFEGDRATIGFYLPGAYSDPELDALRVIRTVHDV